MQQSTKNVTVILLCYLIQFVNCEVTYSTFSEDAQAIAEDRINNILNNKTLYNPDLRPRPSGWNNTATNVTVNIFLRNIGMIDDINMEYRVQLTVRNEWEVSEYFSFSHKGKKVNCIHESRIQDLNLILPTPSQFLRI